MLHICIHFLKFFSVIQFHCLVCVLHRSLHVPVYRCLWKPEVKIGFLLPWLLAILFETAFLCLELMDSASWLQFGAARWVLGSKAHVCTGRCFAVLCSVEPNPVSSRFSFHWHLCYFFSSLLRTLET